MSDIGDMKRRIISNRVKAIQYTYEGGQNNHMNTLYIYRMNDGSLQVGNGDSTITATRDEVDELKDIVYGQMGTSSSQ